jgi:hypothetical protein
LSLIIHQTLQSSTRSVLQVHINGKSLVPSLALPLHTHNMMRYLIPSA